VPTSAITGEGIGNLLALIVDSCQNMLAKRLMYSEELQVLSRESSGIKSFWISFMAAYISSCLVVRDQAVAERHLLYAV
jgi:translation initiation factor 5B